MKTKIGTRVDYMLIRDKKILFEIFDFALDKEILRLFRLIDKFCEFAYEIWFCDGRNIETACKNNWGL